MKFLENHNRKGIALFIAVIAVSAITLVVLSIADIAFKEQIITYSGKDSKTAFYAADAGLECALYHDIKKQGFFFAKNSSTPQAGSIVCDASGSTLIPIVDQATQSATTTFSFNLQWPNGSPEKSCAIITVAKTLLGAGPDIHTRIEARGYNNECSTNNPLVNPATVNAGARNLERALEVNY